MASETVRHTGWLTKWPMHHWIGRAKRRFFVLRGFILFYYYDEQSSGQSQLPKGELTLAHDTDVKKLSDTRFAIRNPSEDGWSEALTLAADSEVETEVWLERLAEAIQVLQDERDLSNSSNFLGRLDSLLNPEDPDKATKRGSVDEDYYGEEDEGGIRIPKFLREKPPPSPTPSEPAPFDRFAVSPWVAYILYIWLETTRDDLMFDSFDEDDFVDADRAIAEDVPDGGTSGHAAGQHAPMLADIALLAHKRHRESEDRKIAEGDVGYVSRRQSMDRTASLSGSGTGSERARRRAVTIPEKIYNYDHYARNRLFSAADHAAKEKTGKDKSFAMKRMSSTEPTLNLKFSGRQSDGARASSDPLQLTRKFAEKWRKARHKSREEEEESKREFRQTVLDRWATFVVRWMTILDARSGKLVLLRGHVSWFQKKVPAFLDMNNLLRAAIRHKHINCVEYLLDECKVDINAKNAFGNNPIMFSMLKQDDTQDSGAMLKYLLKRGADPTGITFQGQNLLFNVARNAACNTVELFEMLLRNTYVDPRGEERTLNIGQRDTVGSTVLHHAVLFGNVQLVEYILKATHDRIDGIWTRANWIKTIDTFSSYNMSKDEHVTARNSWAARGLTSFAEHLSPLGVAILHNQGSLARLLMSIDCGSGLDCRRRRTIFYDDNEDLRLLAKVWPSLIPALLQQFSVKTNQVANLGYKATRYIIHPWFGHHNTPIYHTPLAVMLRFDGEDWNCLYNMRIIQVVITLKWQLFGKRYYYGALARYVFLVVTYIFGFILDVAPGTPMSAGDAQVGEIFRWFAWLSAFLLLLHEEFREMYHSKWEYFMSAYNWLSLVGYTCILIMAPLAGEDYRENSDDTSQRIFRAVAGVAILLRVLEFLSIHNTTGRLVAMLEKMMKDTLRWAGIFFVLVLAFTLSFNALLAPEENFENLASTMFTAFRFTIGEADPPFSTDPVRNAVASLFFVAFTVLVHLLYLNVLIAMLSASYDAVQEDVVANAAHARASALIQWEATMSTKQRQKIYRKICPLRGHRRHYILPATAYNAKGITDLFCEHNVATLFEPDDSFLNLTSTAQRGWKQNYQSLMKRMDSMEKRFDERISDALEQLKGVLPPRDDDGKP